MIEFESSSVMNDSGETVTPETSVFRAASELRRPDTAALVVLDGESVVGIVTESDVVAVVAERGGDLPVREFMSTPVVTVTPDRSARAAADLMRREGVTVLPVVDDGYCGLLTRESLAPTVARNRLDVDWQGEPLTLGDDGSADVRGTR
jgi:CBS domain-containing protein